MVLAVAYRLCGDAALAEDIAQDAFIRVWDRLSTFRPEGNFKGWLCRIATNLTIDALRRKKPTVDVDGQRAILEAPSDRPEVAALKSERALLVRAAILRLPEQSRATLVLREYEGFSYREIADTLDIPLGTVKSRLNDARQRLRAELAEYVEE
jgi:RNA polymerase sigma-70 factor (ECF subfamily)